MRHAHPPERTVDATRPGGSASVEPAATARAEWTCPMHPEVVRDAPGSCPICGMALEPRTARLDEGENPELADMRHRFWWAIALGIPVFVLAMGDMVLGRGLGGRPHTLTNWIGLVLSTPVVWWTGWRARATTAR